MKKIIAIIFLTCCSAAAYAASESEQQNILNQQSQVIQNQKQIEHERELQVDLKKIAKEQESKDVDEEFESEDLSENDGKVIHNLRSIQCFRLQGVIFFKNKLLTSSEEKLLSEKYLGRCLTLDWLTKFDKEVTNFLANKGYATSKAVTNRRSLVSGVMEVDIIEGLLEKIIINDDKFFDKAQLLTIFGFDDLPKSDQVLNLHEIETALERFNALRSNNAAAKIIHGSAPNKSIIVIENRPKNTTRVNISYDNIGTKKTGERRENIAFAQDNLLHLNDTIILNRTSSDLDPKNDRRRNIVFNGSLAVPFGQHVFTFSGARNSYFFLTGSTGTVRASGFTATKAVSVDSLLIKNKKYKISSSVALSDRDNQIFTDDVRNESQSRRSSIATLALANTFFFDSSTLFLKQSYSKSLNILNAKKDGKDVSRMTTHADLEVIKFYSNYSKQFVIPRYETPASYNVSLDSQLSKNHLYSIDQFSSGGFYSVRGFRSGTISGDSGYNIRNEVTTNLGKLILPQIAAENNSQNFSYLNYFSAMPFYDYGHVQTRGVAKSGRVSSAGFKIGFVKKNTNASLTFSRAISGSRMISQNYNDGSTVYFDVGTELDFF